MKVKEFFQSKKGRVMTGVIILLLAAGLGYWYYGKNNTKAPASISKVKTTTPTKPTQPVTNPPVTQPTAPATPALNIDSIKNAAVEEIKAEMKRLQDSLDAKNAAANQPVVTTPVTDTTKKATQVTLVIKTGDHNVRPPKGVIFQDSVGYSIRNSDYALLSDADKAQLNGKPFKKKM